MSETPQAGGSQDRDGEEAHGGDPNHPTIDPAQDDPEREGEERFDAG